MRVNGVVAGTNVLRGLPENRTSIGSALVDTATEVASGVGIAVVGTILAAFVAGNLTGAHWHFHEAAQFNRATTISGWTLTAVAAVLVLWGFLRPRAAGAERRGPHESSRQGFERLNAIVRAT